MEKRGIPCDSFKQREFTNEELKTKMEENTVKILTMHSSKGLQNKYVAVVGARMPKSTYCSSNKEVQEMRLNYVAATRAEDMLVWIIPKAGKKKKTTTSWE